MAAYTPVPDQEGVIVTAGNWQIQNCCLQSTDLKFDCLDTWNDRAVREAWDAVPAQISTAPDCQWKKRLAIYSACKTEMERQAWNWIIKNKPSFEFNAVLAAFTVKAVPPPAMGCVTNFSR
jgi:hypothetical protein